MVVLQPVSALVKGNVSEQYNILGNAKRALVKDVKPGKLEKTVTEPTHELPDSSNSSIFLEDYLDHSKSNSSKVLEGFKEVKKGLFDKKGQKEFKNEAISFSGILPDLLSVNSPIRLEYGKTVVSYVPTGYTFKSALVNQNSVFYNTDKRNTYFTYTLNASSFKEEITLLAPQENYSFSYTINIDKGSLIDENGHLYIIDSKSNRLFELKAPVAVDANGNELTDLNLSVTQLESGYSLTLTVNSEWMNSDDRVYPVIIDPVFTDISNEIDTSISETTPTVSSPYDSQLVVGYDGTGRNRSFFKINNDLLQELEQDASVINQATLTLYAPNDTQLLNQRIQLCSINESFDFINATWENGNDLDATCQSSTPVIAENLKYFTNYFPALTALPTEFTLNHVINSGVPTTAFDAQTLYTILDGNNATYIQSINGEQLVNQEIVINLNKFIRPEEVYLNYGGDADSSGENLTIQFINTNTNESITQLVSNGMSSQTQNDNYEQTLSFEPTLSLYNQVKLTIESTQAQGKPRINEFQITKYQLEEHFVKVDLTSYLQDLLTNNLENRGFYLRFEDEMNPMIEFTSNDSLDHKPEISVDYESIFDVSPNYPLEGIQLNLRPIVTNTNGNYQFQSITFDGVSKPGSEVSLYLNKVSNNEAIINGEVITDITNTFISPLNSNFKSSNNLLNSSFFVGNELYQVEAEAKKDGVTSTRTKESFIIAHLGYFNNLADLAFFYGVDAETIKQDNQIVGAVNAQSRLFIRNPKRNIGVAYTEASTKYITETKSSDYLLGLNSFNEYYQNRINLNTGNYYLSHTDMTYMMFGEEVSVTRVFNSQNSLGLHHFGKSWEYNFNYILLNYDDNKLVFKKEDGQKIYFEKTANGYTTQNNDTHTLALVNGKYQITAKDRSYYFSLNNQIEKITYLNGNEVNYVYDENLRLYRVILENGDELELTYNSTGLIESLSYVSVISDKRTTAQRVTYVYNADDQLKQVTDPIGFKTYYEYDQLGRIISWTDKSGNLVDQVTYDNENRVTALINANNVTNNFKYYRNKGYTEWFQKIQVDGQTIEDKLIQRISYNEGFKTERIDYTNGSVELKKYNTSNGQLEVETLMNGTTLKYAYDTKQNITSITRSDGKVRTFTYDSNNNRLSETDFNGNLTQYTYTNNLRTKITYVNGSTEQFTYENTLLKTSKDRKGNITTFDYDGKGRLVKVTYPNSETQQTQYNLMGYPTRETDTFGNKRVISRNYLNEIVYETTFEGDITETTYTGNGLPLTKTDGNSNTRRFEYDNLNQLTKQVDSYGNYVLTTYDSFGNKVREDKYNASNVLLVQGSTSYYDLNHRLIRIENIDGSYEKYQYNIEGELERKVRSTTNSEELVTLYRYDRFVNKVIQEHLPDGNIVTRNFDSVGNLLQEVSAEGVLTRFEYNSMNQLTKKTEDSGLVTTFEYDANGNQTKKTEHVNDSQVYYTNWSDWTLASQSGVATDKNVETYTEYREKEYEERWVNANAYLNYQYLSQERELNSVQKSWLHTQGYGNPWTNGFVNRVTIDGTKPANLYGYKDYEYAIWGGCIASDLGTDTGGTYCKKFYLYYVEYLFGGYPTNFTNWQKEPILKHENNIVETQKVYKIDGVVSTTYNPSNTDTELIDKESLLKRKFYSTTGMSAWTTTQISGSDNVVVEERFLYRSSMSTTKESSKVVEPGYIRTTTKREQSGLGGYQHTNLFGFAWKDGLLGEIVLNGNTVNLYGYKDYDYRLWGDCSASEKATDAQGSYCKKTQYRYVLYTFESSGEYGEYQEDKIIDTSSINVQSKKEYRSETRSYTDYQFLADELHPNESNITLDEIYVRSRSKMTVPNDTVISMGDSINIMTGVSAVDAKGNNITNLITTNVSTVDTSKEGTVEIIYTLGTTGLEVIRVIEIQDNRDNKQLSTWTTQPESLTTMTQSSTVQLVSTQNYKDYLISPNGWVEKVEVNPGTTPATGTVRILESNPYYKERTKSQAIIGSSTPPDSSYQYVKQLPTVYTAWTDVTLEWDSCTNVSANIQRGGFSNDWIKKKYSVISGYWTYAQHPGDYQYAYYPHTRCGVSVRYKYGNYYAGANTAYRVMESTRGYYEQYEFIKFGAWSSWISGNKASDTSYDRLNQNLYRYLDGTMSGWIPSGAEVPTNYYPLNTQTRYTYQTRSELSAKKYALVNKGETKSLSSYYSYIDPISGDLSSQVSIQVSFNGEDVTSQLIGTQFTFNEVGQYEVKYQVNGLESIQTIAVKGVKADRVTEYTYNSMDQMTSSKDAMGNVTTFAYSNGQLVTKTDALGNKEVNTFNRNNQLVENKTIDGNNTTLSLKKYEYDGVGNKTSETDLYGFTTKSVYDANGLIVQSIKPVFDANNELVTATTQYYYDGAGRLVEEINPLGKSTKTTYDVMSRVVSVKNSAPNVAEVEELAMVYDINGQVTKLTKQGVVTDFTYNKFGDILVEKSATGLYTFREYDKFHRLTKEIKADQADVNLIDDTARITRVQYNHLGRVSSKNDVLGRRSTFKYDAYGNVVAQRDFDGLFTQTFYNANNQVELFIDARGNHTYNYYNALNQLVRTIDGTGSKTDYQYNAMNHLVLSTNALNESTLYEVNMYGNVTKKIDAKSNTTIMVYGPNQKVEEVKYYNTNALDDDLLTIKYDYDKLDNLVKESKIYKDALNGDTETVVTTRAYNAFGNCTQSIDERNFETVYEYNGYNQLIKTQYPNGLIAINSYDPLTGRLLEAKQEDSDPLTSGRSIQYTYNVFGEMTKEVATNGSFKSKEYRVDGQVKQESFSNDNLTSTDDDYINTYTFDSNGRLIQVSDNATYNAETQSYSDQILETRTYTKYGDLKSTTNQSGLTTDYNYDAYGRQISKTAKNVLVETTVNGQLQSLTQDLVTTFTYDGLNRIVQTVQPNGVMVEVDYDEVGNVVTKTNTDGSISKTESYEYNRLNQVVKSTNALNEVTHNLIDPLGRTVKVTYPNNETLETTYDTTGNKIKEVAYNASNELVKQTEWVYDSMKRVTQIKELRTLQGVTDEALTTYTYSAFGDLITVQDPSGFSVTYSYDSMGNKTKTSYANEHEIDYTYTLGGQLKEKSYSSKSSDPFNLFTVREIYTYTKDGKLQTKVDNPPVSESENKKTETYRYTNGLLTEKTVTLSSKVGLSEQIHGLDRVTYTYNAYGQVLVMQDLEGQTENHYSMSGQLSEVTRIQQNVTLNTSFSETNRVEVNRDVVRYEMDRWGNQTKILYPDTSVVTKTYDVLNRLQSVTDVTGTTHYTYHTNERKVVETRPNGDGKTTLTEWGQVTSLVSTRYDSMLETDVVVFEQSLNYDESGNVIHEVRKLNDDITTIDNEYNKRGELTKSTQVNGSTTTVYTYLISPYGNKSETIDIYQDDDLDSTTKAYVYNHLNQLESLTVGSIESEFEYDEYGNLILETNGSSTKSYSYDLNNRLIEAVEEDQTLKFTYDGNGNRLTKSIGSTVVQYVNDTTIENEQVLSYKVGSDVTNLSYGLTRLNEDAIGYLSDSYGNIVQHGIETYAYTPYGELTQGIINGVNEAGYKGEVHDTSSLQYLRARTYHTKLKQFLSEDTVVGKDTHPLSQNRYAFVLNNPFKYSDPSGHYAIPVMMEDRFTTTTSTSIRTTQNQTNQSSKTSTSNPVKKETPKIDKSVVSTRLEIEYKKEVEQNQKSYTSAQEVIQKNHAKNEENLSKLDETTRAIVEEQIKNRDILKQAAKSKEENLNREIQERILAQQNEERNKLSQTGSISAVVGFLAFAGFMSIAAIPASLMVLGGITVGTIATALLGIGFTSGIIGFAAGLALHNTGTRGTDLAGRTFSNREAQVRKSSGGGIMLANAINLLGFTFATMDYYNANKPTVISNTNSSNSNQESNNQNQLQSVQDDPTDDLSNKNSNEGGLNKIVNSADDVVFKQSSIDKAFTKHSADFGKYADGSKASLQQFQNDVSNLINNGIQKSGTWKGVEGTHIYNATTKQWAFVNADGTFNTAFKLSDNQFKYLLESGVVK